MVLLAAIVIVVGVLCLLNLLLTFGVIRRLREHTEMIARAGSTGRPSPLGLQAGEPPGSFSAVTTDGEAVPGTSGLAVVAFFSTSCSGCLRRVAPFTEYVGRYGVPKESVLSVVVTDDGDASKYLESLGAVSRVCVEQDGGAVGSAFKVRGFPAFCLLGADGSVVASKFDPAALPELAGSS